MELEQLASGTVPSEFPYAYESEYDAASPWSLSLAFFPETRSLGALDFATSQKGEALDADTVEYVRGVCESLGWKEPRTEDQFLKTRLRQTDQFSRQMDIPEGYADNAWIVSVVRVLQLYRRFTQDFRLSLMDFEHADAEDIFPLLLAVAPPKWDLRQRLDFLIMPYLRYKQRTDLIEAWVGKQDLADISLAVFVPELRSAVLAAVLEATTGEISIVQQVVENVRVDKVEEVEPVTLDSLVKPTRQTVEFLAALVEAAPMRAFNGDTFRQLAEWALGPQSVQEGLLVRFLQAHFSQADITVLRKTVFSKVPADVLARECVRAGLRSSRFVFIKTNLVATHREIVVEEVMKIVNEFEREPNAALLPNIINALGLLDEPEIKDRFERLNKIYKTFGLEPGYVLSHEPLQNVSKALEIGEQAYVCFTDLVSLAGPENGSKVAERCVEAALADDDFEVALEFFDRGFVDLKSDTAWLAYYQAGKYMSPHWDLPRPVAVLKRQNSLLATALQIAPESDLTSVLRAWIEHDKERVSVEAALQEPPKEAAPVREEPKEAPHFTADTAKDQLSSIFKSGIGWVVGANPPP